MEISLVLGQLIESVGLIPFVIIGILFVIIIYKIARSFIKFAFTIGALIILVLVIMKLLNPH